MRIAVIHGNDGSEVRVGKTCRSLRRLGQEVYFIGWDRDPDIEKKIDLGTSSLEIMKLKTRHRRWNFRGQVCFSLHIARKLSHIRPRIVCCVNEDLSFLLLPFRKIFYKYLVCDVYDALADRHSNRSWLFCILLKLISFIVRSCCDRLIVTDSARYERYGRFRRKCTIVENVPEDPGENLSKTLPQGNTKIYVTGSLSWDKGLENIIKAVEGLDGVEIISSGWPYYDYAETVFIKHQKVCFKGIVTLAQSLQFAAQCDAVFAFYAPVSVNNRYASPSKIYDALSVGRPVIINSEVRVAKLVKEKGIGYICDYDDVEGLKELIVSLKQKRKELASFAPRARELYLQNHTWEIMEKRLGRLYDELAG